MSRPLTLGERNEPEPDLTVVRADSASKDHHPGTAVIAIEVSGDSLRKDRGVKAWVYARFGITEYWIVNVESSTELQRRISSSDRKRWRADVTGGRW